MSELNDRGMQLFGRDIGNVQKRFSCGCDKVTTLDLMMFHQDITVNEIGFLYVAEHAVCFYSDLFDTRVIIDYTSIKYICKESFLGLNTGISIHYTEKKNLLQGEDKTAMFRSFLARDEALNMIKQHMEAAKAAAKAREAAVLEAQAASAALKLKLAASVASSKASTMKESGAKKLDSALSSVRSTVRSMADSVSLATNPPSAPKSSASKPAMAK